VILVSHRSGLRSLWWIQVSGSIEGSCRLWFRVQRDRQPFQVQHSSDQQGLLAHPKQPAWSEPAHPVPVLRLAEEFFDLLATSLGELVAPTVPGRDIRELRGHDPFRTSLEPGSNWLRA
jgi:hypothetical protein